MERTRTQFFYGWVVVAVTALTLLISAGERSAPGVYMDFLRADLGWSRATIASAVSLGLILFGLAGPFSGWLIDRYGPRRLMLAGLLLIALSTACSALMTAPWQLYLLWGVVSGVGTGIISSTLGATVATRWFVARRGLVSGIFGAATSAGQLVFVSALVRLAELFGAPHGWRSGMLVLAGIAVLVGLPALLLMRDDPAQTGQQPLGVVAGMPSAPPVAEPGILRRALRTPTFWLLVVTFGICGATSNGLIGVHFVAFAADCGITPVTASNFLVLMGLCNFVGTLLSGWLTDRYDPRRLLCCYYAFRGLSLIVLPLVEGSLGMAIFAVLFGLDFLATVPPTIAIVADTFGRRNVGTVYGWIFCAHQVGAALAAWLGGLARDSLGNYVLAFICAGCIGLAAGLLSLTIRWAAQGNRTVAAPDSAAA